MSAIIVVCRIFLVTGLVAVLDSELQCQIRTDTAATEVPPNLFPFIEGRQFTYSGFLRNPATDSNLTSSYPSYQATWTIVSNNVPLPHLSDSGKFVSDTTRTSMTTLILSHFFKIPKVDEEGTLQMLVSIGRFYRIFGIARSDSMKLIEVLHHKSASGAEWTAYDETFLSNVGQVRNQYVSRVFKQGQITVPLGTFDTYTVKVMQRVYIGGGTAPVVVSPILEWTLAQGIGPIRMIIHSDGESYGHYRELTSTNFIITQVQENRQSPATFVLHQNYPNPFNSGTTVFFSLSNHVDVHLSVFDLLGKTIQTHSIGISPPGEYSIWLDATNWPSGTYLYRLETDTHSATRKFLLIK